MRQATDMTHSANGDVDALLRHLGDAADAFARLEEKYVEDGTVVKGAGLDALLALSGTTLRMPAPVEGGELHRALVNALYCAEAVKDALGMSADIDAARRAHKETP